MRNLHVVTCPGCGKIRELVRKLQGTHCRRCAADLARQNPKAQPAGGWPDCIEWEGKRDRHGYGRKYIGEGKERFAHRLAYIETYGPIPPGLVVRHRCDFPPCVNPLHLLVGTQADNVEDATVRGRMARGEQRSTLTALQVLAIRRAHASGTSQTELARVYGYSLSGICSLIHRRSWAWLVDTEEAS